MEQMGTNRDPQPGIIQRERRGGREGQREEGRETRREKEAETETQREACNTALNGMSLSNPPLRTQGTLQQG